MSDSYAELMGAACRRFATRPAIDGCSYEQLWQRSMALAGALRSRGVRRGSGVAVLASNGPIFPAAMIACAALGARYTPLHPLGGADDQRLILDDAEAELLIFSADRFEPRAAAIAGGRALLRLGDGVLGESCEQALATAEPLRELCAVDPDEGFALSYTGGTTGVPKGVLRSHRTMRASALMCALGWDLPGELRFLVATPMSHGAGTMAGPVMLRGGSITCLDRFTPSELVEAVARHRITATFAVPTMLYALLEELGGARAPDELRSLEAVLYGGAPANPAKVEALIDALGPILMQFYGQTEVPNAVSVLPRDAHLRGSRHRASAGWALYGADVEIHSPDGERLAPGEVGELTVRSPAVMRGYWRRERQTRETLRGGRLYTGDVATLGEDGLITIVGRSRDVVISGGFNVYPGEVERAIAAIDGVRDVAVLGLPDPYWGEKVTAFVVCADGAALTEDAVRAQVRRAKGPVVAPKRVVFLESIPTTGLGKPDREALRHA